MNVQRPNDGASSPFLLLFDTNRIHAELISFPEYLRYDDEDLVTLRRIVVVPTKHFATVRRACRVSHPTTLTLEKKKFCDI
jgi:hypothetical protein